MLSNKASPLSFSVTHMSSVIIRGCCKGEKALLNARLSRSNHSGNGALSRGRMLVLIGEPIVSIGGISTCSAAPSIISATFSSTMVAASLTFSVFALVCSCDGSTLATEQVDSFVAASNAPVSTGNNSLRVRASLSHRKRWISFCCSCCFCFTNMIAACGKPYQHSCSKSLKSIVEVEDDDENSIA